MTQLAKLGCARRFTSTASSSYTFRLAGRSVWVVRRDPVHCDHDDMGNNFIEVAFSCFGFLSRSGTYQLTQQEAASSFDNGRLYFESSVFHIHIVRERSAWLVEFASSSHPNGLH